MLEQMYIRNSINYKENCNVDLEMLKHCISDFKKLPGTISGNIHTVGNNLRRQNKQIMGFLKQLRKIFGKKLTRNG